MKIRQDTTVTAVNAPQLKRIELAEEGTAHIIEMLIDQYSNPVRSGIAEAISNSLDSHAAKGTTAPVRVSTPDALNPHVVIADSGTGMSLETIQEVYVKVGASSKRDSDEYTGAYGIGAKALFAVTSSFTVTSVHDGMRREVWLTRNENGEPVYALLSAEATDEPTGVTVSFPVPDPAATAAAIRWIGQLLPAGALLIDGQPNESLLTEENLVGQTRIRE